MSNPTREHLLGYLLGALERREHEQVAEELGRNPRLREELASLERVVATLGLNEEPLAADPPAGLAARTCQMVDLQQSNDVKVTPLTTPSLEGATAHRATYSLADMIVAAAVLIAAATLFFPALANSRFQADVVSCQNRMRHLSLGLHGYSEAQPSRTFPEVSTVGNRAAAGVYAPVLLAGEWVNDSRCFVCPSSSLAGELDGWEIPSLEKLDNAVGATLAEYQKKMGGSFGYTLGYAENGEVRAPQDNRRPHYVLLADAPCNTQPSRRSLNHLGRGQNVLYEDGHIAFLTSLPPSHLPDDPFHNRNGVVAAGVDKDDSVVGCSTDKPVPQWIGEQR